MSKVELRNLPSVDRMLSAPEVQAQIAAHGQPLVTEAVRDVLQHARSRALKGEELPDFGALVTRAIERVGAIVQPSLRPVINATGVIVHTNLGRAPLSAEALAAVQAVGEGYSTLEYDLAEGGRGSRHVHTADLLCRLTGAEAALVVNNNAAAVVLALSALARGREVVISRGQLGEIGGGFRVPEVMEASGARLVEVGTTNRTYVEDYERAITPETAALLLVHSSNFRMVGFTHQAGVEDLAALARARDLLLIYDLGSGALFDTAAYGIGSEPTVPAALRGGADLVCFSGDKLLGGPQAGIIAGRADLVAQLARFPLTRALRVGKTTLAALQATLTAYARGSAQQEIPIWSMITAPLGSLQARAAGWGQALAGCGVICDVLPGESTVGGGSLPGETFPTRLLALTVASPDLLAARLRGGDPPVIARIEAGRLLLDPRTVLPSQDAALLKVLRQALAE